VIVPVYNDPRRLVTCLQALCDQTYPRNRFQIIVVDNGENDNLGALAARFPEIFFVREDRPGSYAARNRGLEIAAGDIVAFTDADCIPHRSWLRTGVRRLLGVANCGLVGGAIEFAFESPDRRNLAELYDAEVYFKQEDYIRRCKFACTANAFTFARVVRHVGGFDDELKSVGDRDFGNRIAAAGYTLAFAPDAVVVHPARHTVRALLRKRLRVAGGHHDLARRSGWPFLRFLNALRRELLVRPLRGLRDAARIGRAESLATALAFFGLSTLLCYAEGLERIRLQLGGTSRR
jgi:glycosyltransferase involved in cell wall biosynthesis